MADLPTPKVFSSYQIRSIENFILDNAVSFRSNARDFGGQMWTIFVDWPELDQSEFEQIYNFLLSRRGAAGGTVDFSLPDKSTPRGVGGGTPLVIGASQTGNSLNIDGCPLSTTGWLLTGDLFTLASHSKVYRLTADADTDGGGAVTLAFEPDLVESPPDNDALTISGVKFTTVLEGTPDYSVNIGPFYSLNALFYEFI